MHTSYFDLIVPLVRRNLVNLRALLEKGEAFAAEHQMSEETLLASRLAPDMFPLLKQVQVATDNAKGMTARLAGIAPMSLPDTETSLAELYTRIDTVLAHLDTYTAEHFADAPSRQITLPYFPGVYFTAQDYVVEFALANFFFHINTSYAILRSIGVPLEKQDYLGPLTLQPLG